MRRISTATRVVDKFGAGKDGFTNGDAVAGLPSTDLEDVWFDHVQEEIANAVEASGQTLDASNRAQLLKAIGIVGGHGQCRLSVASATSLKLSPYNGRNVVVNGLPLQIPAAGITVTNAGLTASTLYYVYLAGTTAASALVLSTTGHVNGANGVEVKSGDATQTLVGMIYTNASSQFVDSSTSRYCLNWFNRRNLQANAQGLNLTTTSLSAVELSTTLRCGFLNWADEQVYASAAGNMFNVTTGDGSGAQLTIDGATPIGPAQNATSFTGGQAYPYNSATSNAQPSEGVHFTTLYAQATTGGTATFSCNNSVLLRG
ncbi:hypothetical protein [Paraburkholderia terrae]|uniref:hypothetical protein n=1 Tax=Paraburkholderia terrae TaxID=311230 RepID=UPI001EE258B0|nr:hypothetical protein [Paraburkholderia terrae]GJH05045.1 hypothetical protein CBA19C8_30830 [Paraburkholderia terrae]